MEAQPSAVPLSGGDALDLTVVDALERLSEALRVLLWRQAGVHKLSPIQLQFLQFVSLEPGARTNVTDLARRFNLTKPTVSEAVRTLEQKQLLVRQQDAVDQRRQHLQLTEQGVRVVAQIEGLSAPLVQAVTSLGPARAPLAASLMDLIAQLQAAGVITVPRMCATCRHYRTDGPTGHYCRFLDQPLEAYQRRLNCLDHTPV